MKFMGMTEVIGSDDVSFLPVSDKLVHPVNEIFFLFRHVYELPLNAAHLCPHFQCVLRDDRVNHQ